MVEPDDRLAIIASYIQEFLVADHLKRERAGERRRQRQLIRSRRGYLKEKAMILREKQAAGRPSATPE